VVKGCPIGVRGELHPTNLFPVGLGKMDLEFPEGHSKKL